MGYMTRYELELPDTGVIDACDLIEEFREKYECAAYALDEDGEAEESCKWYSHEKELKKFSESYPDVVFMLSGEGKDSGDIWKKYFLGGKVQVCKAELVFEEYDPKKLS